MVSLRSSRQALARRMKAVSGPTGSWREPVAIYALRAMDRTERFYKIELLIRNRGLRQLRGAARRAGGVARHAQARPAVPARPAGRADRLRPRRQRLPLRPAARAAARHELPGLWFSDKRDPRAADHAPADPGAGRRRRARPPPAAAAGQAARHARQRRRGGARADAAREDHRRGAPAGDAPPLRAGRQRAAASAGACELRYFNAQPRQRKPSARCRRSAWCTTATPGTWTPGATAATGLRRFALDAVRDAQRAATARQGAWRCRR